MREYLVDQQFGTPILEYIRSTPLSARHEFETLATIVSTGIYGYGLEGEELAEFAQRCLHAMLDAGAKPLVSAGAWRPIFTDRWGTTREEITEAILADWQARGGGELEWGEYPFAFVEQYHPDGWPLVDDDR